MVVLPNTSTNELLTASVVARAGVAQSGLRRRAGRGAEHVVGGKQRVDVAVRRGRLVATGHHVWCQRSEWQR